MICPGGPRERAAGRGRKNHDGPDGRESPARPRIGTGRSALPAAGLSDAMGFPTLLLAVATPLVLGAMVAIVRARRPRSLASPATQSAEDDES